MSLRSATIIIATWRQEELVIPNYRWREKPKEAQGEGLVRMAGACMAAWRRVLQAA